MGGAQFLGEFANLLHERRCGGDVSSRNKIERIRKRDDLPVLVHNVHGALAHAGVANTPLDPVQRHDCRKHPRELAVGKQRDGHHQCGGTLFAEREWVAYGIEALDAEREGAFQGGVHKRVVVGADAACGGAFGCFAYGGDVENIRIVLDEVLEEARDLRRVCRIVHIVYPAGERQHLPLAEELLPGGSAKN